MTHLTRFMRAASAMLVGLLAFATAASAQIAPTQTTLSAALSADTNVRTMIVASATGFNLSDAPAGVAKMALIDRELLCIRSVNSTVIAVVRGCGTRTQAHASGATVTVSGAPAFVKDDVDAAGVATYGQCTSGNELYLPVYNVINGRRWNCINSVWMIDNGVVVLPPQACQSSVSGNLTGTNGFTALGTAPSIPVVQASTSATGTNTHYYMCNLNSIRGATAVGPTAQMALLDVVVHYGTQTTALGTQVATLASGTMNSKTVFTSIAYPTPAASETATGLAEAARADSGTMVITPAVGSFNVGTTTAGEFFSAKFTPGTQFLMATDLKQYLFTFSLLNTATSATVTNVAGVTVHFAYIPD